MGPCARRSIRGPGTFLGPLIPILSLQDSYVGILAWFYINLPNLAKLEVIGLCPVGVSTLFAEITYE